MELINSLLQEKEHRICSKQYKVNDHSRRLIGSRADRKMRDYMGYYVYPDDATDIKAHPFFHGLSWDRLHLSRPPFVPDVKSREDTKYFDEEDPISDVVNDSSYDASQQKLAAANADHATQVDGPLWQGVDAETNPRKAGKEKKRPRDRVLRDKVVGRQVLELRKKGAFLGYAYHRPGFPVGEEERGRQGIA